MLKKRHALPLMTLLLCVVFVAMLPIMASATAVVNFSSFTYANYFSADYTVASTEGNASASGATISLDAKGVNATLGCNSTPAVSSTTTVNLTATETVSVTCAPGSGVTVSYPSEVTENDDGSKTFIVQSGQKVSFSVTASNATKVSGTVTFSNVESTTSAVPEDCAAFSYNDKVYNYLDKVITDAAANGSGTIIVTASGKVYHSSVETDEDYASKTFTFTIPKGVTLLLPYSGADTSVKTGLTSSADYLANGNYTFVGNTGGQQAPNSDVTYSLTVPTNVTLEVADGTAATVGNCGRIVVGGTIASGNGSTLHNGATYGAHSNLILDGTLDLGNYAVLATTGYVLGSGHIYAEGVGAQIFEPYVVEDFPGAAVAAMSIREGSGGSTQPSGESKVSPYIYWGVVNIQTKLTMNSGNFLYAYATLGDNGKGYHTNAALVGNSSVPALLVLDSDATFFNEFKTTKWSGYSYGLLGRNQIRVEGGASMGSLKLEIDVGAVDTSSVVASIGYNMDVTLANGHDYSINKSTMLLPGARLTVANDATLTIGDNSEIRFAVWDGLIHRGYRYTGNDAYEVAAAKTRNKNVNYPTNVELDKGGLSEDAELVIDGKVVIGANASFGGIIQTSGGGTVEVDSAATTSVKVQANILDRQSVNLQRRVMASMSMFDSTAKLNLNGMLKDIEAGKTYIGTPNTGLTNTGFTNIYYPGYDSSGKRVAASDLTITYNSAETIKGIWVCEEHTLVTDLAVAPTCSKTGLTEGSHCSVCGVVLVAQEVVQAKGHTEETLAAVAPTCTATGLTEGSKCSVCGETIVAQKVVDALGHSYKAEVTTDPTCTSTGIKTFTCSVCGDTYTETIEMKDHSWVDGVCSVCGGTCNHSNHEEGVVTDPTCTEGGYTTYTCKDCGVTYRADVTEAMGHTPGTEATCTEVQKCTICGAVIVEALGHNYSVTVIAPTCTEAGYSIHTCSTCGDTYRSDETSALGHKEVTDEAVAPTCTESGLTEGKHCSVCSEVLVKQEEVPALGHTEVADAAVAPTCTETGLTEGSHCSVCGEVIIAQGVIPVIDHQYEGDSCSQCGAAKPAITQVGRTLRYEDKISIIYIFDVNSEVYSQKQEAGLLMWTEQDYEDAGGSLTMDNASTYRGMSAYDWGSENSSTYYYAESSGLLAAELDEIRYYAGYVKTADGSYMISDITTYSPAEYAYNMIKKYTGSDEKSTRQETYDLCIALLNYISAGQQYFRAPDTAAIAEENLVNYDLRNMGKDGADLRVMKHTWIKEDIPELKLAEETVETERIVAGGVSNIFTKAGGNLLFGDMVSMGSLYEISKPATVENADAAGTIIWTEAQWNNPDFAGEISISTGNVGGGEQKAFAAYPGLVNTYYSLTPQMAPKEMADTKYYFLGYLVEEIVAEGEETATVTHYSAIKAYTVEEYIYNTVNSKTATDEMKELAKRLYYYERAAKAALPGKS